jgi:hypothetical protein
VNQWLRTSVIESARSIPQKRKFPLLLMVFEVRTAFPFYAIDSERAGSSTGFGINQTLTQRTGSWVRRVGFLNESPACIRI